MQKENLTLLFLPEFYQFLENDSNEIDEAIGINRPKGAVTHPGRR